MFDLEEELDLLRTAFHEASVEYALCGGLALGVHGFPRATIDIDLLIRSDDEERAEAVARELGYSIKARPMSFSGGATQIRRVSKIDPDDGETLILDFLLVTHQTEEVWQSRERLEWRGRHLFVVSREGLIALKLLRSSEQDLLDIKRLRGEHEGH